MKVNMQAELNDLKRRVDFNTYDISVKELISMVGEEYIDIAPEYQRKFRWDEERQSELIESVFLGIPVPSLYMATNPDGRWELVDGVQRISSLIRFAGTPEARAKLNMGSELKLKELSKLMSFNGLVFEDLPSSIKLELLLKPLKITTLSDKSDLNVRFDLFERLNKGGVILTNQEIRSCVYRGDFNNFLGRMAQDANFKSVVRFTQKQLNDATPEEFVLRFFAFLHNYEAFDHSVTDFLNDFMAVATKSFDYIEGKAIFQKTFQQLKDLPDGITRNRTTTPANLYEGVAVGAALALKQTTTLNLADTEWIKGNEMRAFTGVATNSRPKVRGRIEFARDKFLAR